MKAKTKTFKAFNMKSKLVIKCAQLLLISFNNLKLNGLQEESHK
jgi:hypothetical protein